VIGSQTASWTPGLSFDHNLCCRCPNGSCKAILDIYTSRPFQRYKERLNVRCFDPCDCAPSFWESRRAPKSHFWECEWRPHTSFKVGLRQLFSPLCSTSQLFFPFCQTYILMPLFLLLMLRFSIFPKLIRFSPFFSYFCSTFQFLPNFSAYASSFSYFSSPFLFLPKLLHFAKLMPPLMPHILISLTFFQFATFPNKSFTSLTFPTPSLLPMFPALLY